MASTAAPYFSVRGLAWETASVLAGPRAARRQARRQVAWRRPIDDCHEIVGSRTTTTLARLIDLAIKLIA